MSQTSQRSYEDIASEMLALRESNRKHCERIASLNGAIGEYQKERREYVEKIQKLEAALVSSHELLSVYLKKSTERD